MTNLVSSICVFPSQQKDKNLSAQEKLISEIAAMGISFAASRWAIYRMLEPVSIQPVASDAVKWLKVASIQQRVYSPSCMDAT